MVYLQLIITKEEEPVYRLLSVVKVAKTMN